MSNDIRDILSKMSAGEEKFKTINASIKVIDDMLKDHEQRIRVIEKN